MPNKVFFTTSGFDTSWGVKVWGKGLWIKETEVSQLSYIWKFMLFSSLGQRYNFQHRAGIMFSLSDRGDHFGHQQRLS